MFGIDVTVLGFIGLVTLAAGGILYALLFSRVENERNQDRRIKGIKNNTGDRETRIKAEARLADASKRRQSVQKSLKELEETTKAKNPNKVGLKEQLKQAGLETNIRQFYIFSILFGFVLAVLTLLFSQNPMMAGAALLIGSFGLPRWFVGFKKKRRMDAFLEAPVPFRSAPVKTAA